MRIIHWIQTERGREYRAWSTVSDTYYGPPLSHDEMILWLVECDGFTVHEAKALIAKVDASENPSCCDHGRRSDWWSQAFEDEDE